MRFTVITATVLIVLIGIYALYLKATYIDEEIKKGSAYGFSIGDTKDTVYEDAKKIYANKKVFISYPLRKDGYGPPYEFKFNGEDYDKIKNNNEWEFYFDNMDFVRLRFENENLVYIYRHRQEIEFP